MISYALISAGSVVLKPEPERLQHLSRSHFRKLFLLYLHKNILSLENFGETVAENSF